MNEPVWMKSVIRDFGRAAGIGDLSLNERDAAALRFAHGAAFRLEYTGTELVMAMTIPWRGNVAALHRLLAASHPKASGAFKTRTGLLSRSSSAVMAIRLAEREATLPAMNSAFTMLWRLSEEIGGVS